SGARPATSGPGASRVARVSVVPAAEASATLSAAAPVPAAAVPPIPAPVGTTPPVDAPPASTPPNRPGRAVAPQSVQAFVRPVRGLVHWLRLDFAGVIGAYWFFTLSLTPSLVPRSWIYQAALSGITVTIGY